MDQKKRCKHCHRIIDLNPHIKNQRYCNRARCQRARKREWQKRKMRTDADYRKNQIESQRQWLEATPDYWQRYRQGNKHYRDHNRTLQKKRDAKRRSRHLAKMDASKAKIADILEGYYHIVPAFSDLAKMDASLEKYLLIPVGCDDFQKSCKEGLNVQPGGECLQCLKKEATHDDKSALPREGP